MVGWNENHQSGVPPRTRVEDRWYKVLLRRKGYASRELAAHGRVFLGPYILAKLVAEGKKDGLAVIREWLLKYNGRSHTCYQSLSNLSQTLRFAVESKVFVVTCQ